MQREENSLDEFNASQIELEMPEETFQEKPIPLIYFEGSKFVLNEEAIKMLNLIDEEILVVSVVGKARTGKSYLMNLLLDNVGKDEIKGVKHQ